MTQSDLNQKSASTPSAGVEWETASCALCGAEENRLVTTASNLLYDRPGDVRVVRCSECGHYYQNPRPTRGTIGLCYPDNYGPHVEYSQPCENELAGDSATDNSANAKPWYLGKVARAVPGLRRLYYWLADPYSELVPPVETPGRALEIGCGSGRYMESLQQLSWDVEGIEPAFEPGERCRARGLQVRTGTFENFEFDASSYDAVISWMVVEHLHDPVAALREVRRILRPGGLFVFSVPNVACWETWWFRRYYFIINEPTHLHHFTPRSIKQLLAQCGFQIVRLHYQPNLYNVVGSLGIWLSARFPKSSLGKRLLEFCESPSMPGRLALAPLAKLAAALRQTGRITIVARPEPPSDENESSAT